MSRSDLSNLDAQIDAICDAFELQLKRGERPLIEPLLDDLPSDRARLLKELLLLECAYRRQAGERPAVEDYEPRFDGDMPIVREAIEQSRGQARSHVSSVMLASGTGEWAYTETDDSSTVLPGMTLGKYRLQQRIGVGGMGTVFLADHTLIKRSVALKVMQPRLLLRQSARQRFLREAQVATRLDHPCIVRTLDVDQDQDLLYLTMDVVRGENLAEHVRRAGPLELLGVLSILEQTADGLQYAHEHGIIHRDIKPQNLMILPDHTIKILDLGLARFIDDSVEIVSDEDTSPSIALLRQRLTATGNIMGTLNFMAPEQALNSLAADARSDIFALGCTAYFLLTGRPPFEISPRDNPLTFIRNREFKSLLEVRADVPAKFAALIEKMMSKRPEHRLATMTAVRHELNLVRRRCFTRGWDPDPKDLDGLQNALHELEIVTGRAVMQDPTREQNDPRSTWMIGEVRDNAFDYLRQLGRDGERGLTQFQIQQIMAGRAEQLRLPQHVVLDQITNGWKGEVFKVRRLSNSPSSANSAEVNSTARIEAARTFRIDLLEGLGENHDLRFTEFQRYVERLATIPAHSRVASVYDAHLHGSIAVLALEYVEGITLRKMLDAEGHCKREADLVKLLPIMLDMCAGLRHVHHAGILHLDLSPDRWLINGERRARLIDAGIASLLLPKEWNDMRETIGTPPVIAPEVIGDWGRATTAADVYALGQIFRFLRTGSFPFKSIRPLYERRPKRSNEDLSAPPVMSSGPGSFAAQSSKPRLPPLKVLDELIETMTHDHPSRRPELKTIDATLQELSGECQSTVDTSGWLSRMGRKLSGLFSR